MTIINMTIAGKDGREKMKRKTIVIGKAVASSPKSIWINPARRIQNNLKNINWYSCHNQGKLLSAIHWVSLIIPLSWPKWFRFCFIRRCMIFLKIFHQTKRTEADLTGYLFFLDQVLENIIMAEELSVPRRKSQDAYL